MGVNDMDLLGSLDLDLFQHKPLEAIRKLQLSHPNAVRFSYPLDFVFKYKTLIQDEYKGSKYMKLMTECTRKILLEVVHNSLRTSSIQPLTADSLEIILQELGEENTIDLLLSEQKRDFILSQTMKFSLVTHMGILGISKHDANMEPLRPFVIGNYIFPSFCHGLARNEFCSYSQYSQIHEAFVENTMFDRFENVWYRKSINLELVQKLMPKVSDQQSSSVPSFLFVVIFIHALMKVATSRVKKETDLDVVVKPFKSFMDKLVYRQRDVHDGIRMRVVSLQEKESAVRLLTEIGWRTSREKTTKNGTGAVLLTTTVKIERRGGGEMNSEDEVQIGFEGCQFPLWVEIQVTSNPPEQDFDDQVFNMSEKRKHVGYELARLGREGRYDAWLCSLPQYKALDAIPMLDIQRIADYNEEGIEDSENPGFPCIKSESMLARCRSWSKYLEEKEVDGLDRLDPLRFDFLELMKKNLISVAQEYITHVAPHLKERPHTFTECGAFIDSLHSVQVNERSSEEFREFCELFDIYEMFVYSD